MRYRVMRNGDGRYYVQYRRFLFWRDYELPVDDDAAVAPTMTFESEGKAVECIYRLMLKQTRPVLVREYPNLALAKLHLDEFAEAKKRVAAAEAVLAHIFGMYNPTERQSPSCAIARAIQGYYDKYPFPEEGGKDE